MGDLLDLICSELGVELEDFIGASVVPGICQACEEIVEDVEPDCTNGMCPQCGQHEVISIVELAI